MQIISILVILIRFVTKKEPIKKNSLDKQDETLPLIVYGPK